MLGYVRGRKSSCERILDAAAELVSEIGSGRLTLDAVAERAAVSKGADHGSALVLSSVRLDRP